MEDVKLEIKKEGDQKPSVREKKTTKTDARWTGIIGPPKFQGETKELHGHVYDIGVQNQADLSTTTTKKLASYADRNCREPQDIRVAIEELEDVTFMMPTRRPGLDSSIADIVLSKDTDVYIKRESIYRQNKAAIFSVELGQCTKAMEEKLESETLYATISDEGGGASSSFLS